MRQQEDFGLTGGICVNRRTIGQQEDYGLTGGLWVNRRIMDEQEDYVSTGGLWAGHITFIQDAIVTYMVKTMTSHNSYSFSFKSF